MSLPEVTKLWSSGIQESESLILEGDVVSVHFMAFANLVSYNSEVLDCTYGLDPICGRAGKQRPAVFTSRCDPILLEIHKNMCQVGEKSIWRLRGRTGSIIVFLEVLDESLSIRYETISNILYQHTHNIDVRQHSNYLLLKCTVAWQHWYTIDIVDPYNIQPLSIPEKTLLSLEYLRNIADFFCKAATGQLENYMWLDGPFTHCIKNKQQGTEKDDGAVPFNAYGMPSNEGPYNNNSVASPCSNQVNNTLYEFYDFDRLDRNGGAVIEV